MSGAALGWCFVLAEIGPTGRRARRTVAGLERNTWSAPNVFWLASGSAEGATPINAFDNALLNAGVGNLNLVKVSSVVPTGAVMLDQPIPIGPGTLVPAVYATGHSNVPGEQLCSV